MLSRNSFYSISACAILIPFIASCLSVYGTVRVSQENTDHIDECVNQSVMYTASITEFLGRHERHRTLWHHKRYYYGTDKQCEVRSHHLLNIGDHIQLYMYDGNWCFMNLQSVRNSCDRAGPTFGYVMLSMVSIILLHVAICAVFDKYRRHIFLQSQSTIFAGNTSYGINV